MIVADCSGGTGTGVSSITARVKSKMACFWAFSPTIGCSVRSYGTWSSSPTMTLSGQTTPACVPNNCSRQNSFLLQGQPTDFQIESRAVRKAHQASAKIFDVDGDRVPTAPLAANIAAGAPDAGR